MREKNQDSKVKGRKSVVYYARAIHRVLGYLALGMVMVYAFTGIMLIHRTGDFMKSSTQIEETLAPGLNADQLGGALKMKYFKVTNETPETITFNDGTYQKSTGRVSYVKKEYVAPFDKLVELHKLSDGKNKHVALCTTIFGTILFLLALTSLFMFKPSSRQFVRNMVYFGVGIALTFVIVLMI